MTWIEPGRPVARPDGQYEVVVSRTGAATADAAPRSLATATVSITDGELRIDLPPTEPPGSLWVRISAAQSGLLLALGRIAVAQQRSGSPAASATLSFGLDLAPERLHIAVRRDPLAPVGTEVERFRYWVDRLTDRSLATRWTRPRHSLRDARVARLIADDLGDRERADRAHRVGERAKRWLWIRRLLVAAVVVIAGAVATASLLGGGDDTGGLTVSTASDQRPGQPGPVDFVYDNGTVIDAALIGAVPQFRPGDTAEVTITATTIDLWNFGTGLIDDPTERDEAIARRNCLISNNSPGTQIGFPAPPATMRIRLARLFPDQPPNDVINGAAPAETTVIGLEDVSTEIQRLSTIADSCDTTRIGPDGVFLAETVIERSPQTVALPIAEWMQPGLWMLLIDAPDAPTSASGAVLLRVER